MANGFKTGGWQKGTQNKVTGTLKEMISQSISKELESLPTLLKNLEPKERIEAIIKLIPNLIPKADLKQEQMKPENISTESFIQKFLKHANECNQPKL